MSGSIIEGNFIDLLIIICFYDYSCSLWFIYGIQIQDFFIVYVNLFGVILNICYIVTFAIYTLKRQSILRQFIVAGNFIIIICVYSIFVQKDKALLTRQIGLLSCSLTVLFFASPLILLVSTTGYIKPFIYRFMNVFINKTKLCHMFICNINN